jgi:hypothetical protein
VSALDELSRMAPPAPAPLSPMLEAELAQLAPVALRRPMRQLIALAAVSLIYGAGVLAMLAMRPDLDELPMGWLVGAGLAWFVGFAVPLYLATVPPRGAVMPRWKLAGAAAVIGSLGFIALGLVLHPSGPSSTHLGWTHAARGLGCLGVGVATALVPAIGGAIVLRRALPVGSRWIAAALGAGGGSLGGLVLHLHCRVTDAVHVGLIHGGVVAVSALLATAVVPRATDPR